MPDCIQRKFYPVYFEKGEFDMRDNEYIIKKYLREKYFLNEYRSEQEYQGLHKYSDIEQEFVNYILDIKNDNDFITVEGYTAKKLCEQYPLSILGAYNYLIYLRENKNEALINLENGLPRW